MIGEVERYINYYCMLGCVVLAELIAVHTSVYWPLVLLACAVWFAL